MSFKGFQKSVVRAPQQFKARFNMGEITKDAIYIDAERRFDELERETKKLHDESKKYFEAINGMLKHQIEFSKAMTEVYKPISGRASDPDSIEISGNIEGIEACEEYELVVKELQETLAPELEMIETRVIRPADELLDVVKVIRKTAVKRDHKQLDYDRRRATLKKLQDKKERTAKDEKAMWKAEGEVEQATQDFNYFNDLLKDELPKLFLLEQQFIQPLFQSFYYMQLNIFYTLHQKMQSCDIGYFDLTLDIEEAFHAKRGDIQERAEALSICKFKTTGQRRPPKYQRPERPALEAGPSQNQKLLTAGPSSPSPSPSASTSALQPPKTAPQPPKSPATRPSSSSLSPRPAYPSEKSASPLLSPPSASVAPPPYSPVDDLAAIVAKKKPPPPKPKAKPAHLGGSSLATSPTPPQPVTPPAPACERVTALYDYAAQAEGDLTFNAGDVIEIVTRSDNANEWWTGRAHGKEGQFPGNYVGIN